MLHFLEEYLQKKIKVAEHLYLFGENFSREKDSKEMEISPSTLSQYIREITELYLSIYESGTLFNSFSLQLIAKELISRSKKIATLQLLFIHPGSPASFYKEKLLVSDASFARIIAQLRKDLAHYNIDIIVKNGYRIDAEDEFHLSVLCTYLAMFYFWPIDEITNELKKYEFVKKEVNHIQNYDFKTFTYTNNEFEINFFKTLLLVRLLRREQFVEEYTDERPFITFGSLVDSLTQKMDVAMHKIDVRFPMMVDACFPEGINRFTKEKIRRLVTCVAFQLELFPYMNNTLPLRLMFFNVKYRVTYSEQLDSINNFIFRASTYLRFDLRLRYEMMFYFITSNDLLTLQYRKKVHLLVFSSIGVQRSQFLYHQLKPLLGYFKEGSKIEILNFQDNQVIPKDTFLITTDLFPELSLDRQFLISDFVAPTDYLVVFNWLKKSLQRSGS